MDPKEITYNIALAIIASQKMLDSEDPIMNRSGILMDNLIAIIAEHIDLDVQEIEQTMQQLINSVTEYQGNTQYPFNQSKMIN